MAPLPEQFSSIVTRFLALRRQAIGWVYVVMGNGQLVGVLKNAPQHHTLDDYEELLHQHVCEYNERLILVARRHFVLLAMGPEEIVRDRRLVADFRFVTHKFSSTHAEYLAFIKTWVRPEGIGLSSGWKIMRMMLKPKAVGELEMIGIPRQTADTRRSFKFFYSNSKAPDPPSTLDTYATKLVRFLCQSVELDSPTNIKPKDSLVTVHTSPTQVVVLSLRTFVGDLIQMMKEGACSEDEFRVNIDMVTRREMCKVNYDLDAIVGHAMASSFDPDELSLGLLAFLELDPERQLPIAFASDNGVSKPATVPSFSKQQQSTSTKPMRPSDDEYVQIAEHLEMIAVWRQRGRINNFGFVLRCKQVLSRSGLGPRLSRCDLIWLISDISDPKNADLISIRKILSSANISGSTVVRVTALPAAGNPPVKRQKVPKKLAKASEFMPRGTLDQCLLDCQDELPIDVIEQLFAIQDTNPQSSSDRYLNSNRPSAAHTSNVVPNLRKIFEKYLGTIAPFPSTSLNNNAISRFYRRSTEQPRHHRRRRRNEISRGRESQPRRSSHARRLRTPHLPHPRRIHP
jgi:hypothetical protein